MARAGGGGGAAPRTKRRTRDVALSPSAPPLPGRRRSGGCWESQAPAIRSRDSATCWGWRAPRPEWGRAARWFVGQPEPHHPRPTRTSYGGRRRTVLSPSSAPPRAAGRKGLPGMVLCPAGSEHRPPVAPPRGGVSPPAPGARAARGIRRQGASRCPPLCLGLILIGFDNGMIVPGISESLCNAKCSGTVALVAKATLYT